mmetsp:Transcript_128872/g.222700  ORF Transcript_128872/g.222700 Transcript_128872/m.222700 type:complete len:189 (-) Transcript_128872:1579-2145(-)
MEQSWFNSTHHLAVPSSTQMTATTLAANMLSAESNRLARWCAPHCQLSLCTNGHLTAQEAKKNVSCRSVDGQSAAPIKPNWLPPLEMSRSFVLVRAEEEGLQVHAENVRCRAGPPVTEDSEKRALWWTDEWQIETPGLRMANADALFCRPCGLWASYLEPHDPPTGCPSQLTQIYGACPASQVGDGAG